MDRAGVCAVPASPTAIRCRRWVLRKGQFPTQEILASFGAEDEADDGEDQQHLPDDEDGDGAVLCRSVDDDFRQQGRRDQGAGCAGRDGAEHADQRTDDGRDAERGLEPLWSILDDKGTQTMMKQLLGEAGSVTDFDSVKQRLEASWYSMDFRTACKFDLTIQTGDTFAAATMSSLLSAAVMLRKMSGIGHGEGGAERDIDRFEFRKAGGSFCRLGHGVQRCCSRRCSRPWCTERLLSIYALAFIR